MISQKEKNAKNLQSAFPLNFINNGALFELPLIYQKSLGRISGPAAAPHTCGVDAESKDTF